MNAMFQKRDGLQAWWCGSEQRPFSTELYWLHLSREFNVWVETKTLASVSDLKRFDGG